MTKPTLGTLITADRLKGVSHFVFTFLLRSSKKEFIYLRWIETLLTALLCKLAILHCISSLGICIVFIVSL